MSKKVLVGFTLFCVLVLSNDTYAQRRRATTQQTEQERIEDERKSFCAQKRDLMELLRRQEILLPLEAERTRGAIATTEEIGTLIRLREALLMQINARRKRINTPRELVYVRTHLSLLREEIESITTTCTAHELADRISRGLERSALPAQGAGDDPYSMPRNLTTNPNERPVSREGLTPGGPAQD